MVGVSQTLVAGGFTPQLGDEVTHLGADPECAQSPSLLDALEKEEDMTKQLHSTALKCARKKKDP